MRPVLALVIGLLATTLVAAEPLVLRFDDEADLGGLRKDLSPVRLIDGGVSGKALAIECLFKGNLFTLPLARDWPAGVLTLWLRDPLFAGGGPGQNFTPTIAWQGRHSDGTVSRFHLSTGRERPFWWLDPGDGDHATGTRLIPRHDGWTRFDIINPGGTQERPFIICLDGREVARTPKSYRSLIDLAVYSGWGGGTIEIDEVTYQPDPQAYRPNVLQNVAVGDEARVIELEAGERLPLSLTLARAGGRASSGTLALRLLDGREQDISRTEMALDWSRQGEVLSTDLPSPPRSGRYWIAATYTEGGQLRPDVIQVPIEVRFRSAGWISPERTARRLEAPWNWLAQAVETDDKGQPKLPQAPPTRMPADWSQAEPLTGCWYAAPYGRQRPAWAGWYRRSIPMPADWKGRRVLLDIDDVQTVARVFAHGNDVGVVTWPGGTVELTSQVTPGAPLDLCLYVTCFKDAGYGPILREILGDGYKLPDWLAAVGSNRGLRGQVTLRTAPFGEQVEQVAITTPGIGERTVLAASVVVSGLVPGKQYRLQASACSAGKPVKELPATPFTASGAQVTVALQVGWPEARRWDLGAPWLYDLVVRLEDANGKPLDTTLPERFGVRDLRFDERFVSINGRHVNLFMPMVWHNWPNPGNCAFLERSHFNFTSGYHLNYFYDAGNGGTLGAHEQLDFCDEAGFGTDLPVSSIFLRKALNQHGKENDPRYWTEHDRVVGYAWRRFGNRASLFFWDGPGGGGNLTMGCMFNPLLQDGQWIKDFSAQPPMARALAAERRALAAIRAIDPSRPITTQDSGNLSDASHITHYAGFMPIQEVIDSPQPWIERGIKPWFISEQEAPINLNWTNACRAKGHHTNNRVDYTPEWAAITCGDRAFVKGPLDDAARTAFESLALKIRERSQQDKPIEDPLARAKAWADLSTFYPPMFPADYLLSPLRSEVGGGRHREMWLNWRADGIGLLCGWSQSGSADQAVAFAPLTGFLGGAPGRRTDKTHIYAPGETLERSAVLLNNSREARTLTVTWRLELAGAKIAGSEDTVIVPAGGVIEHRLSAGIPAGGDRAGRLVLELSENGTPITTAEAAIEVLAAQPCPVTVAIALIDPEGDSAKALTAAGVRFRQVPFGADLSAYPVVVFGRRAFRYEAKALPLGVDLAALTRAGKRVLILEQDEATLRERFRLRTEYISSRNTFGRIAGHAVTKGLSDHALNFWRGSATLTDGYAIAREADLLNLEHNGARWFYPWNDGTDHARPIKWGNRHNVATVVVIKPDTGNFRPLIDCEFAQNYAAAWEWEDGRGRVVFCQLDVSGRSEPEPAAARLLANLVQHCATAAEASSRGAAYLGGERGAELLTSLRIPHRLITTPGDAHPDEVLVLGEASPDLLVGWKSAIATFATQGGTVFVLPKPIEAFTAGFTPFPVTATGAAVDGTLINKPADPLLAGLANGDLHWKGAIAVVALDGLPAGALRLETGILAAVAHGKGRYVLCQFEPATFPVAERFWLLEPQRYAGRALRQMLTNCGVTMEAPIFLAPPRAAERVVGSVDLAGSWQGCAAADEICPAATDPRWQTLKVPSFWEDQRPEWAKHDGFFWYRRTITIDSIPAGANVRLVLGAIKDEDDTWLNGTLVGHIGRDTHANDYFEALRDYALPAGLLKPGSNEITIRVRNISGQGGISAPPIQLVYTLAKQAAVPPIELAGLWQGAMVKADEPCPDPGDPRWHDVQVPAAFNGQRSEWNRNGVLWYRRSFTLARALPQSASPVLSLGAVDDEDDTFINGQLIGHIGKDTNPKNHWMALRQYRIPDGLLKVGVNEIRVRCNDTGGSGGITASPVRIDLEDPAEATRRRLAESPYLFPAVRGDDPYLYNGW